MPLFLVHGLVVDCPVALPAARSARRAQVQIVLTSGRVSPLASPPPADDPVAGRNYTLVREDGAWSVHFPGKALMRWPDGAMVSVVADARLSEPLLSILLAGPALSRLLIARGATLLHASAVASPGPGPAVTGFFGPSDRQDHDGAAVRRRGRPCSPMMHSASR